MNHDPLELLSASAASAKSSVIRDLLEHAKRPGVISMAGGIPDPELFPVAEIAAAAGRVLAESSGSGLQYGLTPGEVSARQALETIVGRTVDPDRVVVTTGSQQGLDLVTKVLVDPGDVVVAGDPSYLGALQAFRSHGADVRAVPEDANGLVIDDVAALIAAGTKPAIVYTVANFSNPTGTSLSLSRREALAALAAEHHFVIVEDDPYAMLRYEGAGLPEIGPGSDFVLRLRSTSKVLAPGLRIGWCEGPRWLTEAIGIAKQSSDLHTSTLSQAIVADLLSRPDWFASHVERLVGHYGPRRDALCEALELTFGDQVRFNVPAGGMFVWAELEGIDTTFMLEDALDNGVAYVPASAFEVNVDRPSELRLSFATVEVDELAEAVKRLSNTISPRSRLHPH